MVHVEALARFKTFGYFCDDNDERCDCDCEKCDDMKRGIIEALEKQIPKKPIDDFRYKPKICPSCHAFLKEYQNFCDNCGQKIEWS